ncbi:NUDIX hydrolase [Aquirufa rosea]|uniref:NUDIX hydrolase n=1 Tax=Aquirufa rosea TaxID=2509241 RepID=UPI001F322E90|nr:NUDIX domain-containing protein [Aquirufa rosea]
MKSSKHIPQLTVDCVIFGFHHKKLKLILSKLKLEKDIYALPGGFVLQEEDIEDAAKRVLFERTGIEDVYLEELGTFGRANRISDEDFQLFSHLAKELYPDVEPPINEKNQKMRLVSIAYYALVDFEKVIPKKIDLDESCDWYDSQDLPHMIFDHREMAEKGLEVLRDNLDKKLLFNNLLSETFTMRELQELYETVYDKPFPANNFQKKILDLNILERLDKKFTGAKSKAPYLYRLKSNLSNKG